ncbi:tetratricopeptide repeat protein [Aequorivita antarctica]|uniref:Tetratricopeptide repeat protein n=1 Tax=Aequorivita antarctica TaxID=153266 RepID=A0A5C6Z303_9FLAO|nr:hypothetical protein [Aequorivita antarctica]TXD73883.1 hypothetical protein ESU54_05285 [Aequorivita antarctica]
MNLNEIQDFIIRNWPILTYIFGGGGGLTYLITHLVNRRNKRNKERKDYDLKYWKIIKPSKKIKKTDFNVPRNNKLISRPCDTEIKNKILDNKQNVILIGGTEPNLKYGKSTLLYTVLKQKSLKEYVVFIPNLTTKIISEDEIYFPQKWLETPNSKFILLVENLNNYKDNMQSLIIYYNLLLKKSKTFFFIITSDFDFDFDWGNVEIKFHKIKLSPIDRINEKDSIIITHLKNVFETLEPTPRKILSFLNLYEELGLNTNSKFIYDIIHYDLLDISQEDFNNRLFTLEAIDFIIWKKEEIKLKKSIVNPDFSNYDLVKPTHDIDIHFIENYFSHNKNFTGLIYLSSIYADRKNFQKSKKTLLKILEFNPRHTKAKYLLGEVLLKEYQTNITENKSYDIDLLDEAIDWYETTIRENNNFYKYKLSLAFCFIKRGQSPKNSTFQKLDFFEKALTKIDETKSLINLDNYSFNYAYAVFYKKLKQPETSLSYYKIVMDINYSKFNYKLFTEYAELLYMINKHNFRKDYTDEIEKYLLLADEVRPKKYYKTNYVLANFYNWRSQDSRVSKQDKMNYKKLSIYNFDLAFENSDNKYLQALKGKAKVLISQKKSVEAIEILKNVVQANPNDFYSLKAIGTAYARKENVKKAISYYLKAIDKSISMSYIKTMEEIEKSFYPKLFKELQNLSNYNEFIELLESAKKESIHILAKRFIEDEIYFTHIAQIKNDIDEITEPNDAIENRLNSIRSMAVRDFKNKTLAVYFIRLGDLEKNKKNKVDYYKKAENILLNSFRTPNKKPHSYYKHMIVISSKISLIEETGNYIEIIKKFEKQIEYSDNSYAEIHFEFAKYLDSLLNINYDVQTTLDKCIDQYLIAHKKFSYKSYNYIELQYCENRLDKLKSNFKNGYRL